MRLTIRHFYDFGQDSELVGDDLVSKRSWDALRMQTDGPFGLPDTRERWIAEGERRPELEARAARVLELAGPGSIASYGVGAGLLEMWMQRLDPARELVLTDYGPETVARLRDVAGPASVAEFDLLGGAPLPVDLHLFHRIDTELRDAQWREVFARFAGVRVLVVATEIIDVRRAAAELAARLRRPGRTKAGWIRTREGFEALWKATHTARPVEVADLHGWILEPRR